jgi:hypothetical protein
MAGSIGLNTLIVLEKMEHVPPEIEEGKDVEKPKRDAIFEQVAKIVNTVIVPARVFSMSDSAEQEVLYGTPGYMFSLLSIMDKLEPWRSKN